MRQFTKKERIQFYFNCPEKMEYIGRMIKHTNYKDIVFTLVLTGLTGRPAGIRSRLGRNVVLWVVGHPNWERRGIAVCTILSNNIFTIRGCYLSSPNGMMMMNDEKQYLFRDVQLSNSWFKWSPGTKLQIQTMTKTYTKLQNLTCYTTVLYQMYLALRNFLRSILNLRKLVSVLSLKGNIFHVFAPLYRNEF